RANLICESGDLAIRRKGEMVDRKFCACSSTADHAQRFTIGVADDQSVDLRGCRHRAADKICQPRLAEPKATGADCCGYEIALVDRGVEVPPQRSLFGGKPARNKAGGVFLHDAAVDDVVDGLHRPDRKQDESADAQQKRRQQPEGEPIPIQAISPLLLRTLWVIHTGEQIHTNRRPAASHFCSPTSSKAVDCWLRKVMSGFWMQRGNADI